MNSYSSMDYGGRLLGGIRKKNLGKNYCRAAGSSPWIAHIRKVAAQNGINYSQALADPNTRLSYYGEQKKAVPPLKARKRFTCPPSAAFGESKRARTLQTEFGTVVYDQPSRPVVYNPPLSSAVEVEAPRIQPYVLKARPQELSVSAQAARDVQSRRAQRRELARGTRVAIQNLRT